MPHQRKHPFPPPHPPPFPLQNEVYVGKVMINIHPVVINASICTFLMRNSQPHPYSLHLTYIQDQCNVWALNA